MREDVSNDTEREDCSLVLEGFHDSWPDLCGTDLYGVCDGQAGGTERSEDAMLPHPQPQKTSMTPGPIFVARTCMESVMAKQAARDAQKMPMLLHLQPQLMSMLPHSQPQVMSMLPQLQPQRSCCQKSKSLKSLPKLKLPSSGLISPLATIRSWDPFSSLPLSSPFLSLLSTLCEFFDDCLCRA